MSPYYEDDYATIYHGDCRDVVSSLPADWADLVLTDPPYGMAFVSGMRKASTLGAVRSDGVRQGIRIVRGALNTLTPVYRDDAHFLVFCHWESWPDFYDNLSHLFAVRNALIWHKDRGGMGDLRHEYAKDFEVIIYGARSRDREISGSRDGAVICGYPPVSGHGREHPTEKPSDLLGYFVKKHTPPTGHVLDPFMGSGSTIVAAKSLGRKAIGIELEEHYCEIAAGRLSQGVLRMEAS